MGQTTLLCEHRTKIEDVESGNDVNIINFLN